MSDSLADMTERPLIVPLGDGAVLVRFGTRMEEVANRAALTLFQALAHAPIAGVVEVVPSLVSVLLRYDADVISQWRLAGEVGLRLSAVLEHAETRVHRFKTVFGGETGQDLESVAAMLGLGVEDFVAAHCARPLRVLTTGFAPGFVYCGFHPEPLTIARRTEVRPMVSAGSVLFAAGQTAIAATDIPTGWHVIGRTDFRNFDPARTPPTQLAAGDLVWFEAQR